MTDKALMVLALVAVVVVQIINAVRMELMVKDINTKIDDINVHVDKTVKHTAKAVEMITEDAGRWTYIHNVAHDMHTDVKDLHVRMIDIIKRYINYREPIEEIEEEGEEDWND